MEELNQDQALAGAGFSASSRKMAETNSNLPLEIKGLSYRIGGTDLLRSVDLTVKAGESVAVVGQSGSGKSTLLSIASGLIKPATGKVAVSGTDLSTISRRRSALMRREHIGVVFQSGELLDELTARENVELPALWMKIDAAKAKEKALALLDAVQLADRKDVLAEVLSGGERQRVAVARALINGPALVIADEPTGALDEEIRDSVTDLLFSLPSSTGCGLLVVTHDRQVAHRADRIYTLRDQTLRESVSARS